MKTESPRHAREAEGGLTVQDAEILGGFLEYCATRGSKDQVAKHRRHVLYFRDTVGQPLVDIARDDAVTFWRRLERAPHKQRTRIAIQKSVRRFLRWYTKDCELLELLKVRNSYLASDSPDKDVAPLTPEEAKLLIDRAERARDKALLALLFETTARPLELRELRWRHVRWDTGDIHLHSKQTLRDRYLPAKESLAVLKRWHNEWPLCDARDDDFVFPSQGARDDPISTTVIDNVIRSAARKAGIDRMVNARMLRRAGGLRKKGISNDTREREAVGWGETPISEQKNRHKARPSTRTPIPPSNSRKPIKMCIRLFRARDSPRPPR